MNLLVSFAGVTAFMGTAVLSIGIVGFALLSRNNPSTLFFLGGAICYIGGTLLVTVLGNIPLNEQLAAGSATDPDAAKLWGHYLDRWTMWNHVRPLAQSRCIKHRHRFTASECFDLPSIFSGPLF